MSHRFTTRRRVEFYETDAAGIMHFSYFYRFMETTEHAFYRSLGFSVHPFRRSGAEEGGTEEDQPKVGWPRVHASADFRLPLHFEEEVEIELLVEEIRNRTIRYYFQFWKNPEAQEDRVLAATGRFTVVCVSMDPETRRMKAVAIPGALREKLSAAPAGTIPSPIQD